MLAADAVDLSAVATFSVPGGGEISAFDPTTNRLFVTKISATPSGVSIFDLTNVAAPVFVGDVDLSAYGNVTSVTVKNGLAAASVVAFDKIEAGSVVFFDAAGIVQGSVTVGALPDMLTYTPDGSKILVANEGEPSNYESPADHLDPLKNPEGSISIITLDLGNLNGSVVETADFLAFSDSDGTETNKNALRATGVRLLAGATVTVAMDLEPEYITIAPDGATARVTLQEANAVAVVDIATATVTSILPLGLKDYSQSGAGLDASDRDVPGSSNNGIINIQNWPAFGLYMPDAIASFESGGQTYYVTANEGDTRTFDEIRVGAGGYVLDPALFPNSATLKNNDNLGRLTVSNQDGNLDADAQFERIVTFGGRGFTIWDSAGNRVYDSGDQFERILAQLTPTLYNANPDDVSATTTLAQTFDTRSDNKGPEPEGVTIGQVGTRTLAFIGIERAGSGVMVFDITNPAAPAFMNYARTDGDLATEGVLFVSRTDSPNGRPLVILSNEVSGTVTVYQINTTPVAVAGDDQNVVEGTPVTFDASASSDGDLDALTYSWDFGDGQTAFGATPSHTFADEGVYVVTLTVDDGFGGIETDALTVTVSNTAPTITSLSLQSAGNVEGSPISLSASFVDLGILDLHTATINWGDGSTSAGTIIEANGAGTVSAQHTYSTGGLYQVTLVLDDGDGDNETSTATAAAIGARVNASILEVVGGGANDVALFAKHGQTQLKVVASFFSGSNQRTFNLASLSGILVALGGGNDLASVASNVLLPVILDGGDGNDLLNAGGGASVLLGGDGNDALLGGGGRDILIGGDGVDLLTGDGQEDILIGGRTAHDKDYATMAAIRALWAANASYESRVNGLRAAYLNATTVFDDHAIDLVLGGSGRDWFFADRFDLIVGRRANEAID